MTRLIQACVTVVFLCALASAIWAQTTAPTSGTTLYNPGLAWNGYTVLSPLQTQAALVIDMNGNVVKRWDGFVNSAGGPARVFPNGIAMGANGTNPPRQESVELIQRDFEGNILWRFDRNEQITRDGMMIWSTRQHHDWQREDFPAGYYSPGVKPVSGGGKTLILAHKNHTRTEVSDALLEDDRIIEISANGDLLWEWVASDHIDEFGFAPAARTAIKSGGARGGGARGAAPRGGAVVGAAGAGAAAGAAGPTVPAGPAPQGGAARGGARGGGGFDWLHLNSATYVGPNHWFDAGDQRFAPNNVIISSRQASFVAIIGRDGKIVWRIGPDFTESKELRAIGQIIGQHHAHIIPKGLPGAGNLLVFDNGGASGYGPTGANLFSRMNSRILEINPATLELVWSYTDPGLYSSNISGAQRLPNGNTLITEGARGRLLEVTKEGKVVWEYKFTSGQAQSTVYRGYRLPYDWIPQIERPKERAVAQP